MNDSSSFDSALGSDPGAGASDNTTFGSALDTLGKLAVTASTVAKNLSDKTPAPTPVKTLTPQFGAASLNNPVVWIVGALVLGLGLVLAFRRD